MGNKKATGFLCLRLVPCFAYVGAEDNRKGIPFVKIVSLLCKLIQFLMVALSVTVHKALILLVFLNHPYQSLALIRLFGVLLIIPTPQIVLRIKQFYLGNLSCGISIIHFVLYCTWLLMLRYHFVSTFDNELCNLWRQCVPGGLLLIWYYSAGWGGLSSAVQTY